MGERQVVDRITVSMKVTPDMHEDSKFAARRDDRTLADWVRHCVCFGIEHPELIREVQCKHAYQVLDHGRPTTAN